jgi:DNA-3-methyladenine glycosylase
MKLKRKFYNRPTLTVAKELLGKYLVHKIGKKKLIGKIVETEAYVGPRDLASHASRGRTKRTELMFGPPGHAYIYLIYGMYFCFNIVTERKDYPAAVLIRAIEPIPLIPPLLKGARVISLPLKKGELEGVKPTNGPGKLCRYLQIDKRLNGIDLTGNVLWIEDRGVKIPKNQIDSARRIGVEYAGRWKNKKWRFYIESNPFVSKK